MTDKNTLKTSVLVCQLLIVVQNQTQILFEKSVVVMEQLLATSSTLVISCSGRNTWWHVPLQPSSLDTAVCDQLQYMQVVLQQTGVLIFRGCNNEKCWKDDFPHG